MPQHDSALCHCFNSCVNKQSEQLNRATLQRPIPIPISITITISITIPIPIPIAIPIPIPS